MTLPRELGGMKRLAEDVLSLGEDAFVVTLAQPDASFLGNMRFVLPVPKKSLDGKDLTKDPFFQNPIGAGPFKFVSWQVGGDFVADRNPNYYEQGLPYLDKFTHRTGHAIDSDLQGAAADLDDYEVQDTRALVVGTGFTIGPGVYFSGEFGVRAEVSAYLGTKGLEVTTPKQESIEALLAK